ncbi:MAG: transposase, partial [Desulfomonilaceae bacterium]
MNEAGRIAEECWREIPSHFPHVDLDEFVIIPNHVHGILVITENVGATHASPLPREPRPGSVGAMIGSFKSAATKRINELRNTSGVSV